MPSWGADWEASQLRAAERKRAGDDLLGYLLGMYAGSKPMTAKDACTVAWLAKEAGCEGGVCDLAYHPKNSGGSFQAHIDIITPRRADSDYYWIDVPVYAKGVGRTTKRMPTLPPHETIQHQCEHTPALAPDVLSVDDEFLEWHDIYEWHPGVRACKPELPLLCAMYSDGIRFTRSDRTGKADSLDGFFFHLVPQGRRHSVAFLRKSELCRCGCRGWCSVYPIMLLVSWSVRAMLQGRFPDTAHDGSPWLTEDRRRNLAGKPLRKGVLVWIKGDLIEQAVTYGLRGLGSTFHPCMLCDTLLENMHECESVELFSDLWGSKDPLTSYENSCQECEVTVVITTEHDRVKAAPSHRCDIAWSPPRTQWQARPIRFGIG